MQKLNQASTEKTRPASSGSGGGAGAESDHDRIVSAEDVSRLPEMVGEKSDDAIVIDSEVLSRLAETADGTRDKDLALVKNPQRRLLEIREAPTEDKPLPAGYELIAKVRTEESCKREKVHSVTITTENYGEQDPIEGEGPDAIFLTESAVEKFLYPYYHSQRLWDQNMDTLRAQFAADTEAYGMLHRAPSNSSVLKATKTIEIARIKQVEGKKAKPEWVGVREYLGHAWVDPTP